MIPLDLLKAFAQRVTHPFPWSRGGTLATLATAAPLATQQVPAVRTPLTRSAARAALYAALKSALGREPTSAELKMLIAQSDLETRAWNAMWNWNFGNSVIGKSTTAQWFMIPGDTTHHYRAFDNATKGATYWVSLLKKRFTKAWAALGSEDTYAFAQALKDQSYFEADVDDYASGLAARYANA